MRLTVVNRRLVNSLNFPEPFRGNAGENIVEVKRGDSDSLEVLYGDKPYGVAEELDAAAAMTTYKFGAKVPTQRDGPFVVSNYDSGSGLFVYVKTGGSKFTDAVTNSTTTLTSATAVFMASDAGLIIKGAGIPIGATIAAVNSATSITLSAAATATATGVTITITGRTPLYTVSPRWNTTKLNNLLGIDPEGFAQVTNIRCVPDVGGSLAGKYLDIPGASGITRFWFKVGGAGSAPSNPGTIVEVDFAANAAAGTVADALAAEIASVADFVSPVPFIGNLIHVTDAQIGPRTTASAGTSGFEIEVWIAGSLANTLAEQPYVDLIGELEANVSGKITSTLDFTVRIYPDVITGSEGVPAEANPSYPAPGDLALKVGGNFYATDGTDLALSMADRTLHGDWQFSASASFNADSHIASPDGGQPGIEVTNTTGNNAGRVYMVLRAATGMPDQNVWAFYVDENGRFNFQTINDAFSSGANMFSFSRSGGIGIFGVGAPDIQPATPTDLDGVIAILQGYGFCA